jgi:hypothetical protein
VPPHIGRKLARKEEHTYTYTIVVRALAGEKVPSVYGTFIDVINYNVLVFFYANKKWIKYLFTE